jgi:hypothetical protein
MKLIGRRLVSVLVLILGTAIAPSTALGQGSTWAGQGLARTMDSAMWRAGIMRANAAFTLTDAGYDSDIYYGFFGETVPDASASVGTPVQLLFSVNKTVVLEVYDSPRYDYYLKTKSERAWNNTLRSQLHFVLSSVYLRMGGELADNRRRFSQELDINIREKTKRLDALALWQVTRATSLALIYDRTGFDYGDAVYNGESLAETLNRNVDSLEFATFVHVDPHFRFFVDGQFGNYAFTGLTSQVKNTRSYSVFGGFVSVFQRETQRRVGRIQGYLRLGYTRFDVLDPGQPDGNGLVGDVDLSVGIFRLTNARVYYSKGYEFSIFSGATFYAEQNYGAGLTRLLSRRALLSYDLTFGQSTYPQTGGGGGPYSGVLYRFTTHRLAMSATLSRYLRLSLTGTLGRRVTAETGQAWNRRIIALSLEYGTPGGPDTGPLGGLLRSSTGIID